jgi:thiol-disulfide isomerase/thioredoxin
MALYYLGRDYLSDTTLSKEAMLDKIWKDANNLYPNKIFVQLLMGQMFFMEFSRENTDLFENSRKFFNDNVSLKFINEPLLKQYEHIKFHKKNLEIKHNKIIESLGNSSGRILLDSIMNSNKGKVIYIDFWSIGCAPCIAGLPKVKEMQTFFKDTGFDVVYLCLGGPKAVSDKITLNAGIDRNSITCDKDASLELSRAFKILSIPYYVLINREGFIAETGSYLSPMYYETIGKIKNLLK